MMKILVINCGSSSIKYKLYEFPRARLMIKGLIEKLGGKDSPIKNHSEGIRVLISNLLEKKAINRLEEISVIGHRVVHGGETFKEPILIDNTVIKKIKECVKLAPLHNPANLAGIIGCREIIPGVKQAAVFDTAFYQSMPEYAYMYPIPVRYYKEDGVRKYGFHGTSHQFVAEAAAKLLKKPLNKLRLITCHLGNGCSITAVNKGKAVDTSMGFTPLEGLMMGTRAGDIDVAAVFYLMKKRKLTVNKMDEILNRESGILGISQVSNDFRVLREEIKKGSHLAFLAWEMFIYRIKKYIGAYYFILGGSVDAVCFTAGISENNRDLVNIFRKDINKIVSRKTKVLVVPTDEELMIADLTYKLLQKTTE